MPPKRKKRVITDDDTPDHTTTHDADDDDVQVIDTPASTSRSASATAGKLVKKPKRAVKSSVDAQQSKLKLVPLPLAPIPPVDDVAITGSKQQQRSNNGHDRLALIEQIVTDDSDDDVVITQTRSGIQHDNAEVNLHAETSTSSQQMWTDLFRPIQLSDLCMHVKKLADIKQWLMHNAVALQQRATNAQSMLILSGSTGSAKSTAIDLLCQSLRFNKLTYEHAGDGNVTYGSIGDTYVPYESKLAQFRSFLQHCQRYAPIVSHINSETTESGELTEQQLPYHKRHIIVLEEVPFIGRDEFRHEFQTILQEFVQSSQYLLIYIVTTDNSTQDDTSTDIDYVFGRLLYDYRVGQIQTNAVSATALRKALHRIVDMQALNVKPYMIDTIVQRCQGDVRNAVHALQMYCVPFVDQTVKMNGSTIKSTQSKPVKRVKRAKKSADDDIDDIDTMAAHMESLQFRDESYNLFHFVGKFLYAKQGINVEQLLESSGFEMTQIIDFIQHNIYNHIHNDAVESAVFMSDALSDADVIYANSKQQYGNSTSAVSDMNAAIVTCRAALQAKHTAQLDFDAYMSSADVKPQQLMGKPGYNVLRGPVLHKVGRAARQRAELAVELFQYTDNNTMNVMSNDTLLSTSELLQVQLPIMAKLCVGHQINHKYMLQPAQQQLLRDLKSYSAATTLTDSNALVQRSQSTRQPVVATPLPSVHELPLYNNTLNPLLDDDIEEF